mgnify:CR=1 FL=1
MHIMILVSKYIPSQGGIEIATALLVNELLKRNHSIVIVTSMETNTDNHSQRFGIAIF